LVALVVCSWVPHWRFGSAQTCLRVRTIQVIAHVVSAFAIAGTAGLAYMMWTFRDVVFVAETGGIRGYDPLFQGGFLLVGVATCAIITAAVHPQSFMGNAVLGNPVFTYLGRRSYGLYLFHWPVFQLYRKVASNYLNLLQFIVLFAVILALTELSYRFIEMPVREGRLGEAWHKLRFPRTDADTERRNKVFALGAVAAVLPVFSSREFGNRNWRRKNCRKH
jgi:peptidoglycan/LPS O-acetylase OafA/YrhL